MTTPVREDKNQQENEEDIDEEERYRSRAEYFATRIKQFDMGMIRQIEISLQNIHPCKGHLNLKALRVWKRE